jgi:hypothetical protein
MLDKFLTNENVKVNGEIASRRHICGVTVGTPDFDYATSDFTWFYLIQSLYYALLIQR